MTEMEKKAQELQQKMEAAQADAKAAKEAAEAMKSDLAAKDAELKTAKENINNLDESVKAQQVEIETLKAAIKSQPKSWAKAIREALESKKADLEKMIKSESTRFTMSFKVDGASLTLGAYSAQTGAQAYGTVLDPDIVSTPTQPNVFLQIFGVKTVNGPRLAWREATTTENVDYVDELAKNEKKSGTTFNEKFRQLAKIATFTEISSEADMWFEELVNFVQQEGQRIVLNKVDTEIWSGAGDDTSAPKKIYGVKAAATAFSALAKYERASIAEVIFDAIAQIKKAGYSADSCALSFENEAQLRGLKNANGNLIYDDVNRMLGSVKVYPTSKLTNNEMLVCDSYCSDVYLGSTYELEFSRQAVSDSWRVDFRRICQVKTKTPWKKGLIYVANITNAITAVTKAQA